MTSPTSSTTLLLAVESATRPASVALFRGAQLLGASASDVGQHHAESLLPMVALLLEEAGAKAADIEAFAVGVGPGAFTSIRIGVATIKGLAFGTQLPVAPVSTLAAVAHSAFAEHEAFDRVVAVLDARRGMVYTAEFERSAAGEPPRLVGTEGIGTAASIAEAAGRGAGVAGEVPAHFAADLAEAGRDDLVLLQAAARPRAVAVGELGRAALAEGRGVAASELVPRYLQRPEAEETRLAAGLASGSGASGGPSGPPGHLDTPGKL